MVPQPKSQAQGPPPPIAQMGFSGQRLVQQAPASASLPPPSEVGEGEIAVSPPRFDPIIHAEVIPKLVPAPVPPPPPPTEGGAPTGPQMLKKAALTLQIRKDLQENSQAAAAAPPAEERRPSREEELFRKRVEARLAEKMRKEEEERKKRKEEEYRQQALLVRNAVDQLRHPGSLSSAPAAGSPHDTLSSPSSHTSTPPPPPPPPPQEFGPRRSMAQQQQQQPPSSSSGLLDRLSMRMPAPELGGSLNVPMNLDDPRLPSRGDGGGVRARDPRKRPPPAAAAAAPTTPAAETAASMLEALNEDLSPSASSSSTPVLTHLSTQPIVHESPASPPRRDPRIDGRVQQQQSSLSAGDAMISKSTSSQKTTSSAQPPAKPPPSQSSASAAVPAKTPIPVGLPPPQPPPARVVYSVPRPKPKPKPAETQPPRTSQAASGAAKEFAPPTLPAAPSEDLPAITDLFPVKPRSSEAPSTSSEASASGKSKEPKEAPPAAPRSDKASSKDESTSKDSSKDRAAAAARNKEKSSARNKAESRWKESMQDPFGAALSGADRGIRPKPVKRKRLASSTDEAEAPTQEPKVPKTSARERRDMKHHRHKTRKKDRSREASDSDASSASTKKRHGSSKSRTEEKGARKEKGPKESSGAKNNEVAVENLMEKLFGEEEEELPDVSTKKNKVSKPAKDHEPGDERTVAPTKASVDAKASQTSGGLLSLQAALEDEEEEGTGEDLLGKDVDKTGATAGKTSSAAPESASISKAKDSSLPEPASETKSDLQTSTEKENVATTAAIPEPSSTRAILMEVDSAPEPAPDPAEEVAQEVSPSAPSVTASSLEIDKMWGMDDAVLQEAVGEPETPALVAEGSGESHADASEGLQSSLAEEGTAEKTEKNESQRQPDEMSSFKKAQQETPETKDEKAAPVDASTSVLSPPVAASSSSSSPAKEEKEGEGDAVEATEAVNGFPVAQEEDSEEDSDEEDDGAEEGDMAVMSLGQALGAPEDDDDAEPTSKNNNKRKDPVDLQILEEGKTSVDHCPICRSWLDPVKGGAVANCATLEIRLECVKCFARILVRPCQTIRD